MKAYGVYYWTMFLYGGNWTICSKHYTYDAAKAACDKCEKVGGAKHRILKVKWL